MIFVVPEHFGVLSQAVTQTLHVHVAIKGKMAIARFKCLFVLLHVMLIDMAIARVSISVSFQAISGLAELLRFELVNSTNSFGLFAKLLLGLSIVHGPVTSELCAISLDRRWQFVNHVPIFLCVLR